jgi:hypothetical protein
MKTMTIPKFENESDEANWMYEHREELAVAFHQAAQEGRVRQGTLDALQGEALAISTDELKGHTLVSVLREKMNAK